MGRRSRSRGRDTEKDEQAWKDELQSIEKRAGIEKKGKRGLPDTSLERGDRTSEHGSEDCA